MEMTPTPDLNEMAARVHKANEKWWRDLDTGEPIERNRGELLMLMVSEVAECMEGERKDLMDDHLPHRRMAEVEMADLVIRALDFAGGFEYELRRREVHSAEVVMGDTKGEDLMELVHEIDQLHSQIKTKDMFLKARGISFHIVRIIVRTEKYCRKYGYDLWATVEEKLAYNAVRADHQPEARRQAGGKKW